MSHVRRYGADAFELQSSTEIRSWGAADVQADDQTRENEQTHSPAQ